jgi:hypothetical protein
VYSQTFRFDLVDDILHLLWRGVGFHYDHHDDFSKFHWLSRASSFLARIETSMLQE